MINKLPLFLITTITFNLQAHWILNNLQQLLPSKPVILEAGACDGEDSLRMSQLWPQGTIYSFEPVPSLFLKTRAKTFARNNVHCYKLALSEQTGKATFFVSSSPEEETSGSGSLLEPKDHLTIYPDVRFEKTIEVQTINLDEWAAQNNVDYIDLMWLDMQGAELSVLKAAPRILRTVKLIFIEIAFKETYKNVPLYPEVRSWLESQGFTVIFEETCGAAKAEGNALFIRSNLLA